RLLIENLENRILVGIASFVGIMVIVGWIAINEPARMATFEDQFEAIPTRMRFSKFSISSRSNFIGSP
ncbi:MAG: hypothetical protein AAF125_25895, partial [Chloroflexota bacterium]